MFSLKKIILITISFSILIILYYFLFTQGSRLSNEKQYHLSLIQERVEYKECIKEQSKNIHKIDGYSVQFFGVCNSVYSHMCNENNLFCGVRINSDQECELDTDCNVMVTVKNQDNNIVLKGVSGNRNFDLKPSNPNKEIFGDVVMLVDTHDLPYLVLKDTINGSWGEGYWYHLYSTKNGFKKIAEIGPSYDGFYKDKNGDYLIDVQRVYHPPTGNNSDRIVDEIPYRLVDNHFEIDFESIIVKFSKGDIDQYLQRSTKISKYIDDLFESKKDKWIVFDNPFRMLIHPRYEKLGYPYYDLFRLIRNKREDMAVQYFNNLVPDKYNDYSELFPEEVNTKEKLWDELVRNIKDQMYYNLNTDEI